MRTMRCPGGLSQERGSESKEKASAHVRGGVGEISAQACSGKGGGAEGLNPYSPPFPN